MNSSRPKKGQNSCKFCGEKNQKKLEVKKSGKHTYTCGICKLCLSKRHLKWNRENPQRYNKIKNTRNAKLKKERELGLNIAKFIYWDCRKADRKKGLENDLTKDFIEEQISKSCQYCGDKELRMTLDRIDNSKGHTQDNVVPACLRCNYVRRDMPYEAWLEFAKTMKKIRKKGLFGNWTCGIHRRHSK